MCIYNSKDNYGIWHHTIYHSHAFNSIMRENSTSFNDIMRNSKKNVSNVIESATCVCQCQPILSWWWKNGARDQVHSWHLLWRHWQWPYHLESIISIDRQQQFSSVLKKSWKSTSIDLFLLLARYNLEKNRDYIWSKRRKSWKRKHKNKLFRAKLKTDEGQRRIVFYFFFLSSSSFTDSAENCIISTKNM